MSNYRTLYSLTVEHGYFDNGTCRALRCRISPRGADLWRRRGLLFRQSGPNAWTVLYDSDGAGVDTSSDTLLLEMDITDPAFVLYTQWDGFRPTSAYGLELPAVSGTVEAAHSIRETAPKRGIGESFCTVRIRLTDGLFRAAQDGTPESCTLVFHAPEHRWEYLLETPGLPPIPHVGGPIVGPGVPNVLIGKLPAAVVGDMCVCVGPPDSIVKGSATVMIGGKPAARMGDTTAHGGNIVMGCPTVMIGG